MTVKEVLYRDLPEMYAELAAEEIAAYRGKSYLETEGYFNANTHIIIDINLMHGMGFEFWNAIFLELIEQIYSEPLGVNGSEMYKGLNDSFWLYLLL